MINSRGKLKMSLQELREAINLRKSDWINIDNNNCYAYALGLDIPQVEIKNYAFVPGVISDSHIQIPPNKIFSYDVLLNNICLDLEALDINFREINPLDNVGVDEWKIALFITRAYYEEQLYLRDFHFLRQHSDGFWYHKDGYGGIVSKLDSYNREIINPETCFLSGRIYKKCLSLRLK